MYNGIGLRTVRGSGTNGYVQRNLSYVRPVNVRQRVSESRGQDFRVCSCDGGVEQCEGGTGLSFSIFFGRSLMAVGQVPRSRMKRFWSTLASVKLSLSSLSCALVWKTKDILRKTSMPRSTQLGERCSINQRGVLQLVDHTGRVTYQ